MHQLDLCKGICSQSQLSKIESGDSIPQATTLYMISKRLGIAVNTLFEMTTNSRMDYILEFESTARELVRKKNYEVLFDLIQSEIKNPIFTRNPYNMQFLLWHQGISMYHFKNDSSLALSILQKALNLTQSSRRYFNEREMEIMNSIGVLHFEIGDYQNSVDTYHYILHSIRYPAQIYNSKIKIRIYYNLAKSLTRLSKFSESTDICNKAISLCINSESFYLLGELYYHIGYNYFKECDQEKYKNFFGKASNIFEMTNKLSYIDHINKLLNTEKGDSYK